jgi:hypothetical protein
VVTVQGWVFGGVTTGVVTVQGWVFGGVTTGVVTVQGWVFGGVTTGQGKQKMKKGDADKKKKSNFTINVIGSEEICENLKPK